MNKQMNGRRKLTAFYHTLYVLSSLLITSFFAGVNWDAQSLSIVFLAIFTCAGAFFGANFGEHWAEAKKNGKPI
ncbi:MAG: hypothetical protein WBG58_14730 [Ignavibacteriaceae bacterium]